MVSAIWELRARRVLQTRQMMFECAVRSFTIWSSQNPIFRKRSAICGEAQRRRMRTAMPALTRLSGHKGFAQSLVALGSKSQLLFMHQTIATGLQTGLSDFVIG